MKKISSATLLTLTALLPLLVLPIGETFVVDTKQFLALLVALILLALAGIKMLIKKSIGITFSSFTTILVIFGAVIIAAIFFTNSYPVDNLLGFGGVYLTIILLAYLGTNLADKKFNQTFLTVFGASASLLSLSSIGINLSHNLSFSLVESPLVAAQILVVALAGLLALVIITLKKSKKVTLLTWVMLAIIVAGLGLNLYSILPAQPFSPILPAQPFSPILPSLAASYWVAIDMLRIPQTAILGVGPNNYHLAYAQFKPAWINQTSLWNIQFTSGSNLPLTLLVSTGVLGLASWLYLALKILKQIKYQSKLWSSPLTWMLLTLLTLQLLLPPFTSLLVLFGLVLAAWLSLPVHKFKQITYHHQAIQVLGVVLLVGFGFGAYGLARATAANYAFFIANKAGQNNQITQMYQLQQKAILLNPYLANYRRRYALTNLSIATALANKTNLTDQEQANILQLIQQAIRESRAATQLQPADVRNWQVLAQVYNNLTDVAKGADQWAVNSYVQAIQASPSNPDLRIALGSIFYNVGQYDQASQLFTQAIGLKPDYANAHYNLANTLQNQGKLTEAIISYENVLSLVEPGSKDYTVADEELTAVRQALSQ